MSRRRISSVRRQSRIKRSSSGSPGDLEEDSNIFNKDDPLWFQRMEAHNSVLRPSLQFSNTDETPTVLDSESGDEMPPPEANWWDPLTMMNQSVNQSIARRIISSKVKTKTAAEKSTLHEESLDSLPEKNLKTRKTRLFLGSQKRQSAEDNAFLNVLNDSATTVISDPGPSKRRKLATRTSYLSGDESFMRTSENQRHSSNYQPDKETGKIGSLRSRKSRPAFFQKIRSSQTQSATNVFNNLLENASSITETTIPLKDISLIQNLSPINSKKIKSKDNEQSFSSGQNLSKNVSKKRGPTTSPSKTVGISISSNSSPKILFIDERKRNLTSESNSSEVEIKKPKSGFFSRARKSMEKNAFDSLFTSDEESTSQLNKNQDRNSPIKSVEKDRENKQNRTNLNKSENSRSIPSNQSKNLRSNRIEKENISESNSDIDIEDKNDESTKSSREGNRKSSLIKRVSQKSPQIINTSQNSEGVSVASVNRSKSASKIVNSEEDEDEISVGSQGIVEQINRQKSLSPSKKHNSSLNRSRSFSQNVNNKEKNSRLSESIRIPDRMSTFAEAPQYESTRKIDIPKSTNSQQSRIVSNLNTTSDRLKELTPRKSTDNLPGNKSGGRKIDISKSTNSQQSRIVSNLNTTSDRLKELTPRKSTDNLPGNKSGGRKILDDKETSDVEIDDLKTASFKLQSKRESRHSKSRSINNPTKSESSEKESGANSERSGTISLTEDEFSSKSNNQSPKTSLSKRVKHNFIPSGDSSGEENLEVNNVPQNPSSKPTIRDYEILKPNDIDIEKLKGTTRVVSSENNTSRISKSSPANHSFSASPRNSSVLAKDSQTSLIEQQLRQLDGEEHSGIASVSRQLFHKDGDGKVFEDTSYSTSIHDLRKSLGDVEDSDSEVSENPLITYTSHGYGEEEEDNEEEKEVDESAHEHEDTIPQENLQRRSSPGVKEDPQVHKQKMIDYYFKRRDEKITDGQSQSQKISIGDALKDKNVMLHIKKQVEAAVAPIKKQLFEKPKNLEPPKKKPAPKVTSKKKSKPVDPSYFVHGVVYKQPKLPRPKHWATDHLYKFIWKKIEAKYGSTTRIRSEKFVLRLTEVYNRVMKLKYKNYVQDLDDLMEEMARMGLIVTRKDFNDFCIEFMPYSFREKATPILLPGNKMSIPYDPVKFYTPILS